MNATVRKRIAVAFLVVAIVWFAIIGLLELRYLINVVRERPTFHHVVRTTYEEQIQGVNFLLVLVYLVPGLFCWVMYARFKKEN